MLDHTYFLNSSGTSTLDLSSSLIFASNLGFSNCCVLDGRVTYGLSDLHSKIKCPAVLQYVWHAVLKNTIQTCF